MSRRLNAIACRIHLEVSTRLERFLGDHEGQDLIEYALMAGFVAVTAGAIMPTVATKISTIFSKVASVMTTSASQS
jgi:pilus assembly protein Flp/PilA